MKNADPDRIIHAEDLAALEADKARLDWLTRLYPQYDDQKRNTLVHTCWGWSAYHADGSDRRGAPWHKTAREAIDAAMAESK